VRAVLAKEQGAPRVRRRVLVLACATVMLASVGGAYAQATSGEDEPLSPQQQMNADNANRILQSNAVRTLALPVDEPVGLEFLFVTRVVASAFETSFQQAGGLYVLCDGDNDADSACDGGAVHILRDEQVDGRRVRIAEVDVAAAGDANKIPAPSADDHGAAVDYWRTVELQRSGTPPWVSDVAHGLNNS
jgi:hypothetical protein